MPFGLRPRAPFPLYYRGFRLIRTHGRVYALPASVEPKAAVVTGVLFSHPAALAAATAEELQLLITMKTFPDGPEQPSVVAECDGYDLVRYRGEFHGLPRSTGLVDLALAEDRRRAGVVTGKNREEVEARFEGARKDNAAGGVRGLAAYLRKIRGATAAATHSSRIPGNRLPGYRFTCSAPPTPRRTETILGIGLQLACLAPARAERRTKSVWLARLFVSLVRPIPGVRLRTRLRILAALVRMGATLLPRGLARRRFGSSLHTRHLRLAIVAFIPPRFSFF